jgi:hypothetical protein
VPHTIGIERTSYPERRAAVAMVTDLVRPSALSQESMLSTVGTPHGRLGKMRFHEEQRIPVGVAEPEHRRLGLRLLDGADADPDG